MRLWYQSLTRQSEWGGYNRVLRRLLDSIADPGTTIEIHGIADRGGIGDQYRYLEFIETIEVLENAERAEREGFDAFLVGNIADPGLREAREMLSIPVFGLCETALHVANMMGTSFAIVTSNDKHRPRVLENVARYGLKDRLASVGNMTVDRLVDLNDGFENAEARQRLLDSFRTAADAAAQAGAEVVIPAVGVVMALTADAGLHSVARGTPVLNGIAALVKTAEAMVKLDRQMGGRFTSRRGTYAQPPREQLAELRRFYGHVYPSADADAGAEVVQLSGSAEQVQR